MSSSHLVLFFG